MCLIQKLSRQSRLVRKHHQGLGGWSDCKEENYREGEFVAKSMGLGQEMEALYKQYYDFIWCT